MRPRVVSMTTLLCLIMCEPIFDTVKVSITTNFSAIVLSQKSNLKLAVANGFSIWPLATCIESWECCRF